MHSGFRPLHYSVLIAALATVLGSIACGGSTSTSLTSVTSPASTTRCPAVVTGASTPVGPSGGTGSITIVVARECTWSAASQASWIAITSAAEGQGDGTVAYRVAANADPVARQGTITVSDRCRDLRKDAQVDVRGVEMLDGRVRADRVTFGGDDGQK